MAQTPAYQILPMEEADTLEMADLEARAFEDSELSAIVFGPSSPGMKEARSERFKRIMAEDPTVRFKKVVVDGKMVGFAQWNLYLDTNWHLQEDKKSESPPGVNEEALNEFFGWLYGVRKRRMGGQKYLCEY